MRQRRRRGRVPADHKKTPPNPPIGQDVPSESQAGSQPAAHEATLGLPAAPYIMQALEQVTRSDAKTLEVLAIARALEVVAELRAMTAAIEDLTDLIAARQG